MSELATPNLALALDPAVLSPRTEAGARVDPAVWCKLLTVAESSGVSLVTLADTHRAADGVSRLDALMLAAYLGARSSRIGIMAAADTTTSEPYLLATQVATADFVSAGRAGWLVQVSGEAVDAGYVGPREAAIGPAAWAEAAEFVDVARELWDSWEDGAEIRDITNHRFIDGQRIHHIDFAGEHLTIKGPSITPRAPQGQPPVAVALAPGDGEPAFELAASHADVVFLAAGVDPGSVRGAAAEQGRELRLFRDVELDAATADDLAPEDCDGVRLIATALPEQLARLSELTTAVGAGAGSREAGTVRDRLGLPRPSSRYAGMLCGDGASR